MTALISTVAGRSIGARWPIFPVLKIGLCCVVKCFPPPQQAVDLGSCQTDVIHFGSSYKGVEHEWNNWIKQFESLLDKMYWATATVHLQTAFSGSHTFLWQPEAGIHRPGEAGGHLRCEWIKEDSLG